MWQSDEWRQSEPYLGDSVDRMQSINVAVYKDDA